MILKAFQHFKIGGVFFSLIKYVQVVLEKVPQQKTVVAGYWATFSGTPCIHKETFYTKAKNLGIELMMSIKLINIHLLKPIKLFCYTLQNILFLKSVLSFSYLTRARYKSDKKFQSKPSHVNALNDRKYLVFFIKTLNFNIVNFHILKSFAYFYILCNTTKPERKVEYLGSK